MEQGVIMARKKLTAAQRKAHKKASYYKSEYWKTFDALSFLSDSIKIPEIKVPKKITKTSLQSIRKVYTQVRQKATMSGYVLPTKEEMAKAVQDTPTQQYRRKRAQPDYEVPASYMDFNAADSYLEYLRDVISSVAPLPATVGTEKKWEYDLKRADEAKQRLIGQLDFARMKVGEEALAQTLADNDYVRRIENLQESYAHDIVESIDDDLIPFIDSAIGNALDELWT